MYMCAFFSPHSTSMTWCVAPATFKYSISRHKIAYFKSVFIADLNSTNMNFERKREKKNKSKSSGDDVRVY